MNKQLVDFMNSISVNRDKWIKRSKYYYKDLIGFLNYNIPKDKSILEIGCGTGYLLNKLQPSFGYGIDISQSMIDIAQKNYPHLHCKQGDAESFLLNNTFDFIIISDTIGYFDDIQKVFFNLHQFCKPDTRIIINNQNFLWLPLLNIAEKLGLKMKSQKTNWLNKGDIINLLTLSNFDVIKTNKRLLFPKYIPIISKLINKYVANLPLFNNLCLVDYIIARPVLNDFIKPLSTSIIIPARNESGNIENALKRIPKFGKHIEIIFVEGNSTDDTLEVIKNKCEKYKKEWDVKWTKQTGKGKGDAVRKGFEMAKGDILMILDADLTMPPEDLPKFYDAIASNKGEYINGCRLVYPMENEAMRTLNIIGNKFFSIAFSWLISQRLKDTLCGTKVISKENWAQLVNNRQYFGDFDPFGDFDLIFGAAKMNLKIVEIPIRYKAREYGETNISRFKHGWLLLKMVFFAMNKIKFK